MPVATMANPPEHDFAPSWLKIPNDNQLIAKPHSDQRAGSKYPSHHSDVGRQRSRHPSNESFPGFPPRHPPQQPNIHGYRSRDEKRYRPGPRYHSLDDPLRHSELPSAYAPLNQHNGFLPPPPAMGYFPSSLDYGFHPKRGGPLPLHHNLNRLDPHGYHHGGRGYGGGDGGRGRYGGGGGRHGRGGGVNNKAGPENGESNGVENGGGGGGAGSGGGGGGGGGRKSDAASVKGEEGKTNGDKSALSSHDFPSLSGDADHDVKNESSKPAGAWEKRPGTSNISIGGKKLQLVQKSSMVSDLPTTNGSQPAASKMSPSGVNGVSNLTSGSKASGVQQAVQNKGAKTGRGAVPLSSVSSSVYKSLVPKSSVPTKATTPRKPIAKEVVIRPAPVISNKDKSALPPTSSSSSSSPSPSSSMSSSSSSSSSSTSSSTSLPSPSSNAASSQPSSNPPVKEQGSPRSTSAIDIPTPRMVTGSKVKRTDKVDFLKELRRTGSVDSPRLPLSSEPLVNGIDHYTSNHNDQPGQYHNYHRSSTKQYEKTNSTTIYQQPDPFEDLDIAEPRQDSIINTHLPITKCNGHYDNEGENEDVNDNLDQVTENGEMDMPLDEQSLLDCQPMELSSSLEAEKRLLQEMGWHEHSDNEEGYAPITEDELKEFKIRSQQMGKNGFSRPTQPVILNLVPHPVMNAITTMTIEDAELSSSDESSDDEL